MDLKFPKNHKMKKSLKSICISPKQLIAAIRTLGGKGALGYFTPSLFRRLVSEQGVYNLCSKQCLYPMFARVNASDIYVFKQIFIDVEYSCLNDLENVKFVVDCGANVGYSSVYFLNKFPSCFVASIEPDLGNREILKMNLLPYGDRVKIFNAGVWSREGYLRVAENVYRDGREWSVQVEECDQCTPGAIRAIDIPGILRECEQERISILKIDIEGSEAVVFNTDISTWIEKVENIVIELHDDSHFGLATPIVMEKIGNCERFRVSQSGELTVFKS